MAKLSRQGAFNFSIRNSMLPNRKFDNLLDNPIKKGYINLNTDKRWSEKVDLQEEILFDATDRDYATPNVVNSHNNSKERIENHSKVMNYSLGNVSLEMIPRALL
jgi:hypothetical protein